MSDLREALEALGKLSNRAHMENEEYEMSGGGKETDRLQNIVKAALSANDGEGIRKLPVLAAQLHESARCLGVAQAKEDADAKEYWNKISEAKLEAISTHPAPPSVAVPDGWKLVPIEPTDEMVRKSNWSGNGDISVNEDWARKTVWDRMIYAAPSPDHSGDSSKVVDDLPGMWGQSDLSGGETDVRPPKHHTLKTDPAVFDRSDAGRKPWEIRLNDRDFQVGDTVTLQETVFSGAQMREGAALGFTGKELTGQITYVLRGPKYGLTEGWCIFSFESDHIPDAGKVVPSDWEGWACHKAGKMPRLYGEKSIAEVNCDTENGERLIFLSAAPSMPENEIKARALEEYAAQLDTVFAHAQEAGANDCPAWHAGQFAKDARKQAARLRTAGDEGVA